MATISTIARPAYVYDEVADTWFPVGAQAIAFVQTFEYTATAAQTTFTGLDDNANTLAYTPIALRVYLNGALLSPTTDYVASNGTSIVLSTGASVGDILMAIASDTFEVANTYTQTEADNLFVSRDVSGNVGIGTSTPLARLHVVDQNNTGWRYDQYSDLDGTNFRNFRARGTISSPTAVVSGDRLGSFLASGYDGSLFSNINGGMSIHAAESFTSGSNGTYLTFGTTSLGANTGGGGTERMRISPSGNIGIGTTTPTNYKLEVIGIVEADNYDIGLTTLASDSIALNFSGETGLYTRTAAGSITFTASNYRVGSIKTVRIIPGAALRTLTFPASWVFVGIKPASIAANKVGILTVTSFGTSEGDCVAAWAVQA